MVIIPVLCLLRQQHDNMKLAADLQIAVAYADPTLSSNWICNIRTATATSPKEKIETMHRPRKCSSPQYLYVNSSRY